MCIKNILIYIIIYLRIINCKILTKDEVLKMKDKFYVSFYCKDDICVYTDCYYRKPYARIPDKEGNYTKYITYTCNYEEIELNDCVYEFPYNNSLVSVKCTSDSECLSNKCFKNHCVFDEETPLVHCDNIYSAPTLFRKASSYIYCGKAYGDTCKNNDECSSKLCSSKGICTLQTNGPSDSDYIGPGITLAYISFIFVIAIIIGCGFSYAKYPKIRRYIKDICLVIIFLIFIVWIINLIIKI